MTTQSAPPPLPSQKGTGSKVLRAAVGCAAVFFIFSISILILATMLSRGKDGARTAPPKVSEPVVAGAQPASEHERYAEIANLVKGGKAAAVEAWLKQHPEAIDKTINGTSVLEEICSYGNAAMLDAYEHAGGSLSWKRPDGESPLLTVVWRQPNLVQLVAMVDRLVENGANINDAAELGNCLSYVQSNVSFMAGQANRDAVLKVLDHLLQLGADVNHRGTYGGCSALHVAAMNGNAFLAEALIARGADVNIAGKPRLNLPQADPNYTPLFVALKHLNEAKPSYRAKYEQTVAVLQQHGGR